MSAFDDVNSLPRQQIWESVLSRAVQGENATLAYLELDADSDVPEHSHANEQIGMLLHGSVTFTIGEESQAVEPGGTWCIPPDVPHSVLVGPDGAVIVEVFAPARADWAAIKELPPERVQRL